MEDKGVIILGAGISGISAGYYLGNDNCTVYEKENSYGGLCGSFTIDDFTFDIGIHISFTDNIEVRKIFDKIPYYSYEPNPSNYYKGYWLKHPIQTNLYPLPVEEKIKCIKDFVNKPIDNNNYDNYEDWLYKHYGKSITDNFFINYTQKYWCENAKALDVSWIKNRIYVPTIDEVLNGAMSKNTPNDYYANEVRYPIIGGYKSFLKNMASNTDIHFNKEATLIDINRKIVQFSDGSSVFYNHLISSIPIIELIPIIKDSPTEIVEASEKLNASSLMIVSVGFKNKVNLNNMWFYIQNEDMIPARAYLPSLESQYNVPKDCSSIQFEVYYGKKRKLNISPDNLKEHICKLIEKLGIESRNNIMFIDIKTVKYANIIFDKDMTKYRDKIQRYLSENDIEVIGRFGKWDYLWSDQSMISGKETGEKIKSIIEK